MTTELPDLHTATHVVASAIKRAETELKQYRHQSVMVWLALALDGKPQFMVSVLGQAECGETIHEAVSKIKPAGQLNVERAARLRAELAKLESEVQVLEPNDLKDEVQS